MAKCYDCIYLSQARLDLTQFKCSKRRTIINHNIEAESNCEYFQTWIEFLLKYKTNIQKEVNTR
jgi:hypothetical protein